MKKLIFTLVLGLVLSPTLALAEAPADVSADAVYSNTNQIYLPQNLVGEPDGVYTDFFAKDHYIILDMGQDELGLGDLTLHYELLQYGASYWVDFLDEEFTVLDSSGDILPLGATEHVVENASDQGYRYVRIRSIDEEILRLDAIEAEDYISAFVDEIFEEETPAEEPAEETLIAQGILVTLPDDGDPFTTVDEAVYVIGEDGKRHAFPSETVFYSWYENFDDVAYIDEVNLASYPLGKNVTVRPGTYLVKLSTDPKTYLVEPGGVLRWITSEEQAVDLYGEDWADRVIDVPDVFFTNYEMGADHEVTMHPDGTVGVLPTGEVVFIRNSVYYGLPGDLKAQMRIRSEFFAPISQNLADLYLDGGDFTTLMLSMYQFPY